MKRTALLVTVLLATSGCEQPPQDALAPRASGPPSASVAGSPMSPAALDEQLRAVRAATARFHSLTQAEQAGYTLQSACVRNEAGPGVMGIHRINAGLRSDPALDPMQPEMLLYIPDKHGKLRLVGVEYFVWEADWQRVHGPNAAYPTMFGQTFVRGTHGIPPHYELHVWLWAENPAGLFALWNPALSCPS
jgi:hypothetical protein